MTRPTTARRQVFNPASFTAIAICAGLVGPGLAEPPVARDDQVIVDFGAPSIRIATRDLLRNDGLGGDPPPAQVAWDQPFHGDLTALSNGVRYAPDQEFWIYGSGGFTYALLADPAAGIETESAAMVLVIGDLERSPVADADFETGGPEPFEIPVYGDERVAVSAAAAIAGTRGLRATVPVAGGDAGAEFVPDEGGDGQDGGGVDIKMRCPDDLAGFPAGASADLVRVGWWLGGPALRVRLTDRAGRFEIDATIRDDAGVEHALPEPWVLDAGPHRLRIDWWRGAGGRPDGGLLLWVDGVLAGAIEDIANDGVNMTGYWVGVMGLPAPSAPVTIDFDDVVVWSGVPPAYYRSSP